MAYIKSTPILVAIFMLQVFIYLQPNKNSYFKPETSIQENNEVSDQQEIKEHIDLRNNISRNMNDVLQKYGKLNCELNELKGLKDKELVTGSGGWCRKNSSPNSPEHSTDKPLADALAVLFEGKSVASFGDGPGLYKKLLDKTGKLIKYDAYDGAPFCEEVTDGRVKFLDLTAPQYGMPVYDWVISLEVAEHIPKVYEELYLDNIFRHANEGIVLSWAVPNQNGLAHVNNKAFKDVKSIMQKGGFEWDERTSLKLKSSATKSWLKANTNVYIRTKKMNLSKVA